MYLRFASFVVCGTAVALTACSSGTADNNTVADTGSVQDSSLRLDTSVSEEDTGNEGIDSSVAADTGTAADTRADANLDTKEVSVTCTTPGATEEEECGRCGTHSRLCDTDKKWLPWGACVGETGACVPGETRSSTCGKCGTRMETCSATCGWDPGGCTGEGLCNAGDVEVQFGSCPTQPGYVKTKTCSATTCTWGELSGCVQPKGWIDMADAPIVGRRDHLAVWSGTEMIVWGGAGSTSSYLADGAAYSPSTNSWRTIAAAPSAFVGRRYLAGVWTGTHMLVWGGYNGSYLATGAMYDPAANTWTMMSATGAPSARYYHTAVWSGTEMIVWGGYNSTSSYLADGYAFNPSTNTWRTIAAATPLAGRYQQSAGFAGGKMVIFGGYNSGAYLGDSAAYDPAANSWTPLSPPSADLDARYNTMSAVDPTKRYVAFFGGLGSTVSGSSSRANGAIYDATAGTWKSITTAPESVLPYPRRYYGTTWWSPDRFYIWGGYGTLATSSTSNSYNGTGAVFEVATSTWRAMPDSNAPAGRQYASAVWTGSEAIIWGGYSPTYRNDGKIYRP